MPKKLYPKDGPQGDSELIFEIVNEAIIKSKYPIDLTTQYLIDGVMIICNPKPPHDSSWNVAWFIRKSGVLDTGFDPVPSLADPNFDKHLEDHIHRIYQVLLEQCSCMNCRKIQRQTLKEWEASLTKPPLS